MEIVKWGLEKVLFVLLGWGVKELKIYYLDFMVGIVGYLKI